jgi:hypothetical protein
MLELKQNKLIFRFPELHKDAVCSIDFQRTLRIPDDNREYPLPPGLGRFPIEHTEDHTSRCPSRWVEHGGVLLPMYQSEALWINFSGGYPCAIKIATGKINAVTGKQWTNNLVKNPQDYLVVPDQPWLDGYCVQNGLIRQFVAMPLGDGYTAEEQLTGTAEHGGIQIVVYPMKRDRYEAMLKRPTNMIYEYACCSVKMMSTHSEVGLAPGGLMRQEIYEDDYGFDAWDHDTSSRCFVHILNSDQWNGVTGKEIPGSPPLAVDYSEVGLPWFEYYDDKLNKLNGSTKLSGLDSVASKTIKQGGKPMENNEAVNPAKIQSLLSSSAKVKDGKW